MTSYQLSYWGFVASLAGVMLTLITIWLAKSISNHIRDNRFSKRITSIVQRMRESNKAGNVDHLQTDLKILINAIETNHSMPTIIVVARIRKLYFAACAELKNPNPNVRLIEGLLLNFKKIHAEAD